MNRTLPRWNYWLGLAAIVLAAATAPGCRADPYGYLGKKAPNFRVSPIRPAGDVSLSDYKGKVVVLDFWGTFCGPCKMLMPFLSDLQGKYGSKGLVVMGISGEDPRLVRAYGEQHPEINYPLFVDKTMQAGVAYNAANLPTTVLIGRDGVIQYYDVGFDEDVVQELTQQVKDAVGS